MLKSMNRVLMVAADAKAVGAAWERLLDARYAGSRARPALGARAHQWRLGDGWMEVLTPDGEGVVSSALEAWGAHLFAGGFTTPDVDAFAAHLESVGVEPVWDGERLILPESRTGIEGLRVVVEPDDPQPPVGLIDTFYELTDLVADAKGETVRVARVLGLDSRRFQPIASDEYGYRGTLTMFHDDCLDRLEIITPEQPGTTMRRFFKRINGGLYMAFAETAELAEIERRAREAGAGHTAVPAPGKRDALGAHTLFLHPSALGGMMLGLSRLSYAWTWSGHPDRVETAE